MIAPYDLVVLLMLALKTPPIAGNCFSGWLTIMYEGSENDSENASAQFDKSLFFVQLSDLILFFEIAAL